MTPGDFDRVKEALLRIREAPAWDRARLLESLRAEDASLHAEVESLLGEAIAPILGTGMLARGLAIPPEPFRPGPHPERLGPYRVSRVLGEGGMGTVYLATRDDDVYRKVVAVKLVHGGGQNPEVLRRFRAERQILATLDHPNIARLLDGGSTDSGDPYLAMEYVDGVPIDRYCDGKRLGIGDRLRLFQKVCAAVHHAHRHLVVHRDIKPGNVLVTGDGTPKLLDFGIAKVLEPEPGATGAPTGTGLRLLTPEYASPEQIRGEAVTTATDVHALGLLLYELLSGRRPYQVSSARYGALERTICEQEPERPSTASGRGSPGEGERVAAARGTRPERLRRDLAGDLDNVVLMALRKEPSRRYGSAQQLAEDLARHLDRLPVVARPATVRYRARKWAMRHRMGVVAGAVALLVAGALAGYHAARLARERDRAEIEASKARMVSGFLARLFEEASPEKAQGRVVTAADLLQRGVHDIDSLDGEPRVQAELLSIMGYTYSWMGEDAEAVRLLERSLEIRRSSGAPDLDLANTLAALGISLRLARRLPEAERAWEEALEIRRRVLGPRHGEVADALNNLGLVYYDWRRLPEARTLLEQSLEVHAAAGTSEGIRAADAMNNLGITLRTLGEYAEAEAMHRTSVALNRRLIGNDHPNTATGIANLGAVLVARGKYAEAEPYLRESLAVKRRVLGEGHRQAALGAVKLADALRPLGRFDEARELLEGAVEILRKAAGEGHFFLAWALRDLGQLERDQGRLAAAEKALRRSLDGFRRASGETGPPADEVRLLLAGVLRERGHLREAEALAREVHERHAEDPPKDPRHLLALRELAATLTALGRTAEADPLHRQAVAESEAALGLGHPDVATAWAGLAENALAAGDPQEAVALLERSLAARRVAFPEGHWLVADTAATAGRALLAARRPREAEPLLEEARRVLGRTFGSADARARRAAEAKVGLASR